MLTNTFGHRWKTIALAGLGVLIGVVLLAITIPIKRAKESILKNQLFTFVAVIDQYTYDKGNPHDLSKTLSQVATCANCPQIP